MEQLSRSEKKRRAKGIESMAAELIKLSASEIKSLPCDDFLKKEIKDTQHLKAGARKRQLKYITKQLRNLDVEPLLTLLAEKKGSKLKQDQLFHQLEHWRNNIITEAIEDSHRAEQEGIPFNEDWENPVLQEIAANFQNIDLRAIKIAAARYVKTHKPSFSREIFRIMKAAYENEKFRQE
jgi:ribosome-associated protein